MMDLLPSNDRPDAGLKSRVKSTRRSVNAEILVAVERHLAALDKAERVAQERSPDAIFAFVSYAVERGGAGW